MVISAVGDSSPPIVTVSAMPFSRQSSCSVSGQIIKITFGISKSCILPRRHSFATSIADNTSGLVGRQNASDAKEGDRFPAFSGYTPKASLLETVKENPRALETPTELHCKKFRPIKPIQVDDEKRFICTFDVSLM